MFSIYVIISDKIHPHGKTLTHTFCVLSLMMTFVKKTFKYFNHQLREHVLRPFIAGENRVGRGRIREQISENPKRSSRTLTNFAEVFTKL